jgi:predicted phage-related endonuclease
MASRWGEPGTDEIPDAYLLQCQWYMLLTSYGEWDVAVKIDSADYREYTVAHNARLCARLLEIAGDFWEKNVLAGEPPAPDGSESYARYIQETFPSDNGAALGETIPARVAAMELAAAGAAIKKYEETAEIAKNKLKSIIGEASGIAGTGWKCTWKKSKDSVKTDYERAFNLLSERLAIDGDTRRLILDESSALKPGPRVFRFNPGDLTIDHTDKEAV